MSPWEQIVFEEKQDGFTAKVWNRVYEFEKSSFPTSVCIDGEEILKSPIKLRAFFGEKEGEWSDFEYFTVSKDDDRAHISVSQTTENIILNTHLTIEYDGLIKTDFSIIPFWCNAENEGYKPRLTGLFMDIPIKSKFAKLMHYWPNSSNSILTAGGVINSGAVPDEGMELPFKPYIWCGWEEGGISWCSESDKGFETDNREKTIQYIKSDDSVTMRINLLDHMPQMWQGKVDDWGDVLMPIEYSFGIQATPSRPYSENQDSDRRMFHMFDVGSHNVYTPEGKKYLEEIAMRGVKWLIFHESWSVFQNYGLAEDEDGFKEVIDYCHSLGMKTMVYFGYELSTLSPTWKKQSEKCLIKNSRGRYVGGWQRKPMQRDFMVCYRSRFSDEMLERAEYAMERYGVDGIYTDSTYIPWECANKEHGCGYEDQSGTHVTYPIFAVRDHVKKLYRMVHERGGIVDAHQSSCCVMPIMSFCDCYFDGENIQPMLSKDISFLRLDCFRAEYTGRNLGIPAQFTAYTNPPEYTIEMISTISLLHGAFPRPSNLNDLDYISKVWDYYSEFGTDDATWYPYWSEYNPVKSKTEHAYCSCYEKDGKIFVVASCFDSKTDNIILSVPEEFRKARNINTDKETSISENTLQMPYKYGSVQFIILIK